MKNQKREGKMCPYDTKNKNGAWVCDILNPDGSLKGRCPAPDNIPKGDLYTPCRIITPKKKKSGVVKVKGWAHYSDPHGFYSATDFKTCWNTTPCVITIKKSDIKRGKK